MRPEGALREHIAETVAVEVPELGRAGGVSPNQAADDDCARDLSPSRPRLTPLWALKAVYCIGTGSGACLWKYITVFYHSIGLTNSQIGLIQMLNPAINFVAQIGWAGLCDYLGSYKEVLIVSNTLGVIATCCCLFPFVQEHFWILCLVVLAASAFMASRGSVNDSLALQIVDDYKQARTVAAARGEAVDVKSLPSYGEQRLWGAAGWGFCSLFGGYLMDSFGVPFMFVSFALLLSLTIFIIAFYFPARQASMQRPQETSSVAPRRNLLNFELIWFFANLILYGFCMSLVETFLFVFMLRDFQGTTSFLLGATILVMCAFEIPVFMWVDKKLFHKWNLTTLLSACHVIFAIRCFLYAACPREHAWLVLLIEPLHGITFAAMWSCSVEYAKRLSPEGGQAKMQALVNGMYYQFAIGIGSVVWGPLTEEPPKGYGFAPCYYAAAVLLLIWSVIWNIGWCMRRQRMPDVPLLSGAAETPLS
mmetsp:Transcript_49585/g.105518  ORF Transcript_49585/g.105518 Transcript_49585/m.105518 type:complete len:478 (-) Transcript_49585:58-1491(-)|eukprot:CAMPEP_0206438634 /NCGR_PEP_ID=MMETSP0324_2-20121206/11752_1 /ASSEMBLY_ACC=CAM_ASM_000836 /TAXON_ID=2866 /ORGANISM="Crypthecodinium cohnii, Strain Seligo" /LENGTH=477 /DNA_ID=CAMNT_0053906141 /DNA_START=178 /DNA_END=1611 /DNA_ORIENTATION=+